MVRDAVIVGAGFGGLGAAIALSRLGLDDIVILEREPDLGGTWLVNHYPGLAVDIASVTYSYSFEPNPYWSRLFAPGAELKKYADHVADKYGLRPMMRFNTAVAQAEWAQDAQQWVVTTAAGEQLRTRYLITATGYLSQPHVPDISGIDTFAGRILHTADWDDDFDATGRRIGVIGTGATAVQLIPELAGVAASLTVYQRTPIWVVPKIDMPIPRIVQRLFAAVPLTQQAARLANNGILETLIQGGILHYRQARVFNEAAAVVARAHLRAQVRDGRTRDQLTPHYSFGCKRPTFSNSFYRAFNRKNVQLETAGIDHVTADGIVTADGRKTTLDTIVLATGFNLWDTNFPAFTILGRDGLDLGKWWRETRFQSYSGLAVPKFPNLLNLAGPYSYSGLSYFSTIEAHMQHISRLFGAMRERGATTFEISDEANAEFLADMTHRLQGSVFNLGSCAGANSYYFDKNGEASLLRPTSVVHAINAAKRFPVTDYAYS